MASAGELWALIAAKLLAWSGDTYLGVKTGDRVSPPPDRRKKRQLGGQGEGDSAGPSKVKPLLPTPSNG